MSNKEIIAQFLISEIEKGQSAYEMVMSGYKGDVLAYINDYSGDYKVTKENGRIFIKRKGYGEKWEYTGYGFDRIIS